MKLTMQKKWMNHWVNHRQRPENWLEPRNIQQSSILTGRSNGHVFKSEVTCSEPPALLLRHLGSSVTCHPSTQNCLQGWQHQSASNHQKSELRDRWKLRHRDPQRFPETFPKLGKFKWRVQKSPWILMPNSSPSLIQGMCPSMFQGMCPSHFARNEQQLKLVDYWQPPWSTHIPGPFVCFCVQ